METPTITSEDISITPSDVIQHTYCPRHTYFQSVLRLPQFEEKYYKVMKGRRMHDLKLARNKEYLRKKIGAVEKELDVYLATPRLRGIVDEVLTLSDGTKAPLDYKYAKFKKRIYKTHALQLVCYAALIEETYGVPATRGYAVYIRSSHHVAELKIDDRARERLRKEIDEIREILINGKFPRRTRSKKRCMDCTYRNYCPQ